MKTRAFISSVVQSSFSQLSYSNGKALSPPQGLDTVIHALITSQLDDCYSLYVGLDLSAVSSNSCHWSPDRKEKKRTIFHIALLWIPVCQKIDFTNVVITLLNTLADWPPCLVDLLNALTPS